MCLLGNRCFHGQCVGGPPTLGCIFGGPTGCTTCAVGLMSGGQMMQVDGKWKKPLKALYGWLIPGKGWELKETGETKIPVGAVVISISEDGGDPQPADEGYFEWHWSNLQSDNPAKAYILTYLAPSTNCLDTVTLTRN